MTTATTEQTLREILTVMWLDGHIELTDGPDDIPDVLTVGETAINAALDKKPDSWTLRELYADWLEALGNPRAESQRWMVKRETRPHDTGATWDWWSPEHNILASDIDQTVFNCLVNGRGTEYRFREYPTRTAAELDLHNALCKAGEITCALIEEVEA